MSQNDLTQPQYSNRGHLTEVLQIVGENFVYTVDIPLDEFDRLITIEQLNDQTLQSYVLFKSINWSIDTKGIHDSVTDIPPPAEVTLSVAQDLLTRIGIERIISIECIP